MSTAFVTSLVTISFVSGCALGYLVAFLRHDKPVFSKDDFRGPNFPP